MRLDPEFEVCQVCGRRLRVYKTQTRGIITLAYGSIQVQETVLCCPDGCLWLDRGRPVQYYRSEFLGKLVAPRCTYGFDVLAKVGVLRFLQCRQRQEIHTELLRSYGLSIPEGTIQELVLRFVEAIRALHDAKVPQLRKSLEAQGGYVLHVDGTCEEGSHVHFACLAAPDPMVLWSEKISSENALEIRRVLGEVDKRFGRPAASVEDLSVAIRNAILEQWPGLPIFYCHWHFLADVGRDLLTSHYNQLKALLRNSKIRLQLRQLLGAVNKELGEKRKEARRICQHLEDPELFEGQDRSLKAAAVAGAIAEWILSAPVDGKGRGFPFDLQHLSFYQRSSRALDILDKRVLHKLTGHLPRGERLLFRLRGILHTLLTSTDLSEVARETEEANALFERLRDTLRLASGKDSGHGMNEHSCYRNPEEVREVELSLEALREELRGEQRLDPPRPRSKYLKIVIKHLDKYWDGLFGHHLPLKDQERQYLMVQRTNNMSERFFRKVKRFERRTSGKKKLIREVNALPSQALLVFNLKSSDYVRTVCGSLERLPEALGELAQKGIFSTVPLKAATSILDRKSRRQADFPARVTAVFQQPGLNRCRG